MQLRVGTSGYAYPEWIEAGFYPPDTPMRQMLQFYSRKFSVTELNYTWYRMPRADAMERMVTNVPAEFDFAVKLTRTMTHDIDPHAWRGQVDQYRHGIAPLIQARRLIAILVQLPPSFDRSRTNRIYLSHLLDALDGVPVAVEFRHRSWASARVFNELETRRITLVTVDVPELSYLFPTQPVVTNPDLIYIRFHGRNASGWRSGKLHKQFDYDYSVDELKLWSDQLIPKMRTKANAGVVFFNNHVRGQAPRNAAMLLDLLDL